MSNRMVASAALVVSALAGSIVAQDATSKVEVHAFGDWSYGRTDGNQYLGGTEGGSYDNASLALNVTAQVTDKLHIVGQGEWKDGPEGTEVQFDYAFAEWEFSPKLKLRAGKVKQPFGISAEVFDVGTLRPFLELPQAVYGPAGLVGETYKGIGFTGAFALKGNWGLRYDVYGGGQELEEYAPPEAVLLGEPIEHVTELERTKDMLGARIVFETPIAGLTFGASAYGGHEIGSTHRTGLGVQAEYLTGRWSIRSEYAHEDVENDLTASGVYAEVAYHFNPHWQAAAQYGHFTSELGVPTPSEHRSLLKHEEVALGLNYWFNSHFVAKASYHFVDGNRFAGPSPDELSAVLAAGTLEPKTRLLLAGVQFSF